MSTDIFTYKVNIFLLYFLVLILYQLYMNDIFNISFFLFHMSVVEIINYNSSTLLLSYSNVTFQLHSVSCLYNLVKKWILHLHPVAWFMSFLPSHFLHPHWVVFMTLAGVSWLNSQYACMQNTHTHSHTHIIVPRSLRHTP